MEGVIFDSSLKYKKHNFDMIEITIEPKSDVMANKEVIIKFSKKFVNKFGIESYENYKT